MKEHTSQELSQRLWDAGYRGACEKKWMNLSESRWILNHRHEVGFSMYEDGIPAYTFSELWGVLPKWCRVENGESGLTYAQGPQPFRTASTKGHEYPAEAVGLLLLWLIDNNHVDID